ncbi:MAG: fumarylacetoacetate hydrolase family protein [Betaproteobacteria bacterium]|nr:fumarylacetoacetate hydrolase family protein [Betaproteobacteria bacterium]
MSMDPRLKRAARFLVDGHAARESFGPFPADIAPLTVEEAYAVQDEFVALKSRACGPVVGYKIALTTPAMRNMVGLQDSIGGALHEKQVVRGPASVRAADYGRLMVEFEIAVQLAKDLPAGPSPHTRESVVTAIGAIMPAFELADDRNADYTRLSSLALGLVADNAWNEGAVLGASIRDWASIDLAEQQGTASINAEVVGQGFGRDVMGHPFEALAWVANHLAGRGRSLRAGQLVITGSLVTSKFPKAGNAVSFSLGALGAVELAIR